MKPNKNYYDSLYSKYYDEISEKRPDVKTITRTLATLIGKRKKVLEIGVGTGLYIQELLEINPQQYEIWGIDNSEHTYHMHSAKYAYKTPFKVTVKDGC